MEGKKEKTVTPLCETCRQDSLKMLVRFIQKTSEGVEKRRQNREKNKKYSFHPKIREGFQSILRVIQVWDKDTHDINYYIFKTEDVERFDDLELDTYQVTDNQKTELPINKAGEIVKKGRKYDYSSFKEFLNNFDCLEKLIQGDSLEVTANLLRIY